MQGKNKSSSTRQVRIEISIYVCIYSQNKELRIILKHIKECCMKKRLVMLGPNGQHWETDMRGKAQKTTEVNKGKEEVQAVFEEHRICSVR